MTKFQEYNVVLVKRNRKKNIVNEEVGTIISIFNHPTEAYEVEIIDKNGIAKLIEVFQPNELEKINGDF